MYWVWRGIIAGVVIVGLGLWLLWRGIANDISRDLFGTPLIPRWIWIMSGLMSAIGGLALIAFLLWQRHVAGG